MTLHVVSAGPILTIQDLGREGYERFGVPQSGAMDWFALRAANRLVGNAPGAAALEFALQTPLLRVGSDCLVAAAGRGFIPLIGGRRVGAYRCAFARAGETIEFSPAGATGWGYLAVSGGIDVPLVMGSRSTYLRGGFGGFQGRKLQDGDILPLGQASGVNWLEQAGRSMPPRLRCAYEDEVTIPVIPGPQEQVFGAAGLQELFSGVYSVEASSDRMGYRLLGKAVSYQHPSELLSEGVALGSIQIPPGGQPIVLLADRPATGGYAKIATVARAGIPLLVQAFPGVGRVRFYPVDVESAQRMYREMIAAIEIGCEDDED